MALLDSASRRGVATSRDSVELYKIYQGDAFTWLSSAPSCSVHAVVTDPPYGLVEYSDLQIEKMKSGKGGIWRLPPSFDGHKRQPLPRFTVLTVKERRSLELFFGEFARSLTRVVVPGAHVFVASNPLVSSHVIAPFVAAGFEKRGEIIRIVHTLRGGDRPKNAHQEFSDITVMPKSCWEPWCLFRKSCEGRVQDNLRKWGTGGLRRISDREPFKDLIVSSPARGLEREIAPHPSLKPQHLLRQLVRAALPFGRGIILDPFMGSGATIAAATFLGLRSIGIEMSSDYFDMARKAIPRLAKYSEEDLRANGPKKRL